MSGVQTTGRRMVGGLRTLRTRSRRTPAGRIAWRIGVTLLGVVVVVAGVILLPLPGPGWLIIFGGLGILATEYVWAARLLGFGRRQVAAWSGWAGRQNRVVQVLLGIAGLVLIAAIVLLAWWVYR